MSSYDPDREDTTIYKVVRNHEEQYSIWPASRENPLGWQDVGRTGSKAECLAYIKEVWTDMRSLSLRKRMEEAAQNTSSLSAELPGNGQPAEPKADDLVERLSQGDYPVEASIRPEKNVQAFRDCIDRGYVHIKFTGTRGGTELGVRLDRDALNLSEADFDRKTGTLHLEGGLMLNYRKVKCVADIDLKTLAGQGHLELVNS
jgi:uncharacterized protein YbdZ (MbtH family)